MNKQNIALACAILALLGSDGMFPHAFKVKDGWFIPLADVKRVMKAQER